MKKLLCLFLLMYSCVDVYAMRRNQLFDDENQNAKIKNNDYEISTTSVYRFNKFMTYFDERDLEEGMHKDYHVNKKMRNTCCSYFLLLIRSWITSLHYKVQ